MYSRISSKLTRGFRRRTCVDARLQAVEQPPEGVVFPVPASPMSDTNPSRAVIPWSSAEERFL